MRILLKSSITYVGKTPEAQKICHKYDVLVDLAMRHDARMTCGNAKWFAVEEYEAETVLPLTFPDENGFSAIIQIATEVTDVS
jgi:hypothetical protein